MQNDKIVGIVELLKTRAEVREQAITACRRSETATDADQAAELVNQAHIDELEYVIDELQQLLAEDDEDED